MVTEKMFITAEHTTSPFYGVWVLLTTFSITLSSGRIVPAVFQVTTSTGYRAELPACGRIADGEHGAPCTKDLDDRGQHRGMSVNAWLNHIRSTCHYFHIEHAEAFRDKVQATYGPVSR